MTAENLPTTRRRVLRGTALTGVGLLAGPVVGGARGQSDPNSDAVDLTEWLAKTDDADSVTDWRGMDAVTIQVGAAGNGGAFAFGPPVAQVDPGTTVTWAWTGKGGSHNVVDVDGAFGSDLHDAADATFEYVAGDEGVFRYECSPHSAMGMRGALVVSDVSVTLPEASGGDSGGSGGDGGTPTEDSSLGPMRDFDGWLDDTDNYRGVADERGQSEVTVEVGADGNGGAFAFEPAAVHVDPGTTVVWEWVSGDAAYDVVDETLGYASEQASTPGHTFATRFDGHGESRYDCTKYSDRGMRGVVVVGDGAEKRLTTRGNLAAVGAAGAAVTPLALGVRYHFQNVSEWRESDE